MLTLYHAPASRSTSVVQLLHEMAVTDQVRIEQVTIPRQDGSGQRDAANPHPEGKVPYLTDGTDHVRERAAIILYLTERFDSPLGRPVGHPQRGAYLSWLVWYQGVFEPVTILMWAKVNHPAITNSLRDYDTALARLNEVLTHQPYLLGDDYSAADLLCAELFAWFGDQLPATPAVRAWAARCQDRDAVRLMRTIEGH
ncbi:MAG: glutathione S-transferase family protein [Paracoccus sp. (in: a-proteobacteria)]|uniref:glutathione S-transferase family protein n=1 Tax=Paracoccus sp. TaxID=267 RepID=UPI0026DEB22D|nr:glutathione S-transferase family protein [Paracoccus sp. (in: a-proteobacteria)]MDO5631677.1 glutathione S-transferase family protein [Paracoccus sp. (in: a-proteobacteria)]